VCEESKGKSEGGVKAQEGEREGVKGQEGEREGVKAQEGEREGVKGQEGERQGVVGQEREREGVKGQALCAVLPTVCEESTGERGGGGRWKGERERRRTKETAEICNQLSGNKPEEEEEQVSCTYIVGLFYFYSRSL